MTNSAFEHDEFSFLPAETVEYFGYQQPEEKLRAHSPNSVYVALVLTFHSWAPFAICYPNPNHSEAQYFSTESSLLWYFYTLLSCTCNGKFTAMVLFIPCFRARATEDTFYLQETTSHLYGMCVTVTLYCRCVRKKIIFAIFYFRILAKIIMRKHPRILLQDLSNKTTREKRDRWTCKITSFSSQDY